MRVSVILPTYNRARLLPTAVNSVLRQTMEDLELIVVDDASTDETPALLASLRDPRLRVARMPRQGGAAAARNRGIELAQGEWIAFQDSDDLWEPDKLERQLAFQAETQADAVFCRFRRCAFGSDDSVQEFPHEEVAEGVISYEQLLFENLCGTPALLARASLMKENPFSERYPALEDWALALSLAKKARLFYQKELLMSAWVSPDSLSNSDEKSLAALRILLRENRRGIVPQERLVLQWLWSLKHYARPIHAHIWRECLLMLSHHHSLELNKRLLLEARADRTGRPLEGIE